MGVWLWIIQCCRMLFRRREKGVAHLVYVTAVSDAHGQPKPHLRTAIMPVGHRRVNEIRIRDDDYDVIVRSNHRAPCPNLLHLAGDHLFADTLDLYPIADGDRPLGQDYQARNQIAHYISETETNTDTDRAREYCQRSEMDAGIVQNDDDP